LRGYLDNIKISRILFIGVWIAYAVTCLTRNTYTAAIAAIVNEGLFDKSMTGVINASFYLFYGTAQFVGGYLSDRISPSTILMIGLGGSLVTNAVMASTESYTVMLIAWSINGICQFGVWPATLKIVSSVLHRDHREKAMVYISMCMCAGNVFSYFAAMILLKLFRWPSLFWMAVVILVGTIIMWASVSVKVRPHIIHTPDPSLAEKADLTDKTQNSTASMSVFAMMLSSGFLILVLPATFRCMLDNGAKSWVPTMMMESYGITPGTSSFIATLVVMINMSGVFLVKKLYPKYFGNLNVLAGTLFAVSLPLFAALMLIGKIPMLAAIVLLIASTTVMYAVNQLMGINIPAVFGKYGKTGTIAGILNAFGSFGIMLGNFVYGYIAENFGWTEVIISWMVLAAVSMVCCFAAAPLWKKFINRK